MFAAGRVQLCDAVGEVRPGGSASPFTGAAEGHQVGSAAVRLFAGGRGL